MATVIVIVLLVAILVLLLLVLRAVTPTGAAGGPTVVTPPAPAPGTTEILRAIGRGAAKTFIDNIESIRPGASAADVRRVAGAPDRETVTEWVYYLDPHAGYRVRFNGAAVVESVQPWVS